MKHFEISDWQHEVVEGNTRLGYEAWLQHRRDAGEIQEITFEGISVWVGRDDDGDIFVSINTEDANFGINGANGDTPQLWVSLNSGDLYNPIDERESVES